MNTPKPKPLVGIPEETFVAIDSYDELSQYKEHVYNKQSLRCAQKIYSHKWFTSGRVEMGLVWTSAKGSALALRCMKRVPYKKGLCCTTHYKVLDSKHFSRELDRHGFAVPVQAATPVMVQPVNHHNDDIINSILAQIKSLEAEVMKLKLEKDDDESEVSSSTITCSVASTKDCKMCGNKGNANYISLNNLKKSQGLDWRAQDSGSVRQMLIQNRICRTCVTKYNLRAIHYSSQYTSCMICRKKRCWINCIACKECSETVCKKRLVLKGLEVLADTVSSIRAPIIITTQTGVNMKVNGNHTYDIHLSTSMPSTACHQQMVRKQGNNETNIFMGLNDDDSIAEAARKIDILRRWIILSCRKEEFLKDHKLWAVCMEDEPWNTDVKYMNTPPEGTQSDWEYATDVLAIVKTGVMPFSYLAG